MSIPALTTVAQLNLRLSTVAVSLRTDHAAPGLVAAEVISQASTEVAYYLARYPLADLPGSAFVANLATDVALYHLCRVRANAVPQSVQKQYEAVILLLKDIQAGKGVVPDLSNATDVPAAVNYSLQHDQHPSKRVVAGRSEPRTHGGFPQYPDRREPYSY